MWNFFRRQPEKKKEVRYILSIDGGGMRGIVPASIISRMDQKLREMGDERPFYSHFDLIAGTSTGGLIALGITTPLEDTNFQKDQGETYSVERKIVEGSFFRKKERTEHLGDIERLADPNELLDIYRKNGHRIFTDTRPASGIGRILGRISTLFVDKYDAANIEEFLDESFGDTPLSEAKVPTMAVAFNVKDSSSFVFRSWDSHDFLVKEAARATSAAPTYFAPANFIDRETGEALTLVDGGIIANNPILVAYTEARKLYPDADEFRILSLSTAPPVYTMDPNEFATNLDWMGALIGAYSAANMNVSLSGVEAIKGVSVTRVWEPVLTKGLKLDDVSPAATKMLMTAADKIWEMDEEKILLFLKDLAESNVSDAVKLKTQPLLPPVEEPKALPPEA